jgi:hypothetical protein
MGLETTHSRKLWSSSSGNLRALKSPTQPMSSSTQKLHDHPNLSATSLTESAGSCNGIHSPVDDTSSDPYVLPVDHVPRIATSIRLNENFQVGDLSTAYFRDWLLDMPTFAEEVRVEAGLIASPVCWLSPFRSHFMTICHRTRLSSLLAQLPLQIFSHLEVTTVGPRHWMKQGTTKIQWAHPLQVSQVWRLLEYHRTLKIFTQSQQVM